MPLPDAGLLSLRVHSNALQSKPKHAMIVRMSAETLDALDASPNHPPLSFDFGDLPGIYIGDAFFPMRPQKESSPHELYLRVASPTKPMAPLKLYANVIGKFMVERQLGNKVTDKVRQQTMVAKLQHSERQTILLEQPPIPLPTRNHKRKIPGSATTQKKTASSTLALNPVASSHKPSPTPQSKVNSDLRRRLVHFLAISPRLADDAVKMVGGANITATARDDLLALLDEVAEQQPSPKKGDKSPRPWALKPQSWIEVRPFEWPKLAESTRVTMARQARMALRALCIPESDPAWDNVRYRSSAPTIPAPPSMTTTNSGRSSASGQVDAKRSAIATKDTKKSNKDPSRAKGEIQMKDESTKATTSRPNGSNVTKRADADRSTAPLDGASAMKTVLSRRLPGSGYQVKKSPQPSTAVLEKLGTPVPQPSLPASLPRKPSPAVPQAGGSYARKTIPAMPPKPMKKGDESDCEREHDRKREREERREREKEKQREEKERERIEMETREKAKQKERELMDREKRQREKERERDGTESEKHQSQKERTSKDKVSGAVPAIKRKAVARDLEELLDDAPHKSSKRRKLGDGSSAASSFKPRDSELPNKLTHDPSPVPRPKIKKDPSPQVSTPGQDRRTTTSTSGSAHNPQRPFKMTGGAKPRRRSPIYTSSEDEGEIPQPRKHNLSPPATSDRSHSSDRPPSERAQSHRRAVRAAYPPATDHVALRALYQSQYTNYLGTFSKVVAQKRKIEAMLNGDSEAEVDMMDPEDLIKLSIEHKALRTELEHITDMYARGTVRATVGGTSD